MMEKKQIGEKELISKVTKIYLSRLDQRIEDEYDGMCEFGIGRMLSIDDVFDDAKKIVKKILNQNYQN